MSNVDEHCVPESRRRVDRSGIRAQEQCVFSKDGTVLLGFVIVGPCEVCESGNESGMRGNEERLSSIHRRKTQFIGSENIQSWKRNDK